MPTLVIVDMQEAFIDELKFDEHKELVNGVCDAVKLFKKYDLPIIALQYRMEHGFDLLLKKDRQEYQEYMCTNKYVLDTIGDYKNFYVRWKNDDDGSLQVKSCVNKFKLDRDLYLCGVNAGACVMATWAGLTMRGQCFASKAISNITRNVWSYTDSAKKYINDVVSFDKLVKEIDG